MSTYPPDISRTGTLKALDGVVDLLSASTEPPHLGGSQLCVLQPGDLRELIDLAARLIVPLDGPDRHAVSVRGQRADVTLLPGQIIFFAPGAWTIPAMDTTSA